jgi:hypothetical protein
LSSWMIVLLLPLLHWLLLLSLLLYFDCCPCLPCSIFIVISDACVFYLSIFLGTMDCPDTCQGEAKKVVYGWIIALRCDSFFWLIKEAKKVVYGWKHRTKVWHISRRLWKREDLDKIRPKNEPHFLLLDGNDSFLAD